MRIQMDHSQELRVARWKKEKMTKRLGCTTRDRTNRLARHSYRTQCDPLLTPQLCQHRADAIAFEEQLTRERRHAVISPHPPPPEKESLVYCEKTSTTMPLPALRSAPCGPRAPSIMWPLLERLIANCAIHLWLPLFCYRHHVTPQKYGRSSNLPGHDARKLSMRGFEPEPGR